MKKWKCFLTAVVIAAGSMFVGCQGFSSAKPIEAMYIPAGEWFEKDLKKLFKYGVHEFYTYK